MSDTDDTDFLLFIPPDFFVIRSPECLSPVNYHSSWEEGDKSIANWVRETENHSIYSSFVTMEAASTPSKFVALQTNFTSRKDRDEPLSLQALQSSPRENICSNVCNTWPIKINDFDKSVDVHSSTSANSFKANGNRVANASENTPNAQNGGGSKFNLFQVDQLLNEMEKTRREIKNKLQSNKNKIYEMRREYSGANIDLKKGLKSNFDSKSTSEVSKPFEELKENADSITSPRKQMNIDVLPKYVLKPSQKFKSSCSFNNLNNFAGSQRICYNCPKSCPKKTIWKPCNRNWKQRS